MIQHRWANGCCSYSKDQGLVSGLLWYNLDFIFAVVSNVIEWILDDVSTYWEFDLLLGGSLEDVGLDDGSNRNQDQEPEEESVQANIIAYLLMLLGWFIIIRSIGDYLRARKMERIIATEPSAETMV